MISSTIWKMRCSDLVIEAAGSGDLPRLLPLAIAERGSQPPRTAIVGQEVATSPYLELLIEAPTKKYHAAQSSVRIGTNYAGVKIHFSLLKIIPYKQSLQNFKMILSIKIMTSSNFKTSLIILMTNY